MKRTTGEHPTGIRTSGWAVFASLCLMAQEERGAWFWAGVGVCGVWLAIGVFILAGEMKAETREMRERITKGGS